MGFLFRRAGEYPGDDGLMQVVIILDDAGSGSQTIASLPSGWGWRPVLRNTGTF